MKLPRIPLRRQKLPKVVGKVLGHGGGREPDPWGFTPGRAVCVTHGILSSPKARTVNTAEQ